MLQRRQLTYGASNVMPLLPGRSLEGDFRGGPLMDSVREYVGLF